MGAAGSNWRSKSEPQAECIYWHCTCLLQVLQPLILLLYYLWQIHVKFVTFFTKNTIKNAIIWIPGNSGENRIPILQERICRRKKLHLHYFTIQFPVHRKQKDTTTTPYTDSVGFIWKCDFVTLDPLARNPPRKICNSNTHIDAQTCWTLFSESNILILGSKASFPAVNAETISTKISSQWESKQSSRIFLQEPIRFLPEQMATG